MSQPVEISGTAAGDLVLPVRLSRRQRREHTLSQHRTRGLRLPGRHETLADRAGDWLFPWTRETYPGLIRGFLAMLPRHYTWSAVRHWHAGRRRMPAASCRALADAIEARCRVGMEVAAALRVDADAQDAAPKRAYGCCAVREDGLDRRGGWKR